MGQATGKGTASMTNQTGITPIAEEAAEGEVKEIFEEIKSVLNVPEVPVIYRIMAHIPLYLETSWQRVCIALLNDGVLDKKTKCLVSLAISASNNNKYMILENTERLKAMGTSDTEIAELMTVVDVTNGLNKVLKAAQVNPGT
jgi:alkylhydroperoxidase/carboxymuconolactone decarboxylase family protein YurZ